jgi:hypothetical protein
MVGKMACSLVLKRVERKVAY